MKHLGFRRKKNSIVTQSDFRKLFNLNYVSIPLELLNSMINRTREHPFSEEGGVLVGYIDHEDWTPYSTYNNSLPSISVINFIPSGPRTIRTSSSLYSDLEFQEYEFERLKNLDPRIEHLGSWHSHDCNGLKELSLGDLKSYYNIIESPNHSHDYYLSILLYNLPDRPLMNEQDVFQVFKFNLVSNKTGRRNFVLDSTCVNITQSPILYTEFLHSGYHLPPDLLRKELMSKSWFKGSLAKEVIKDDNILFSNLATNNIGLIEADSHIIDGISGFILVRRFQFRKLVIEYQYPELVPDEGIYIRVYSNNDNIDTNSSNIIEIRIRPLKFRQNIFSTLIQCFVE